MGSWPVARHFKAKAPSPQSPDGPPTPNGRRSADHEALQLGQDREAPCRAAPPESLHAAVLRWYEQHGRAELPWRSERTPFRVWISEIMLQQTRVVTVLPYFERFTSRFPDVAALAAAPLEDVLALWSGLGYYARARNLHQTARIVAARHGGELPRDLAGLASLPGIGRSTAGAILSLAYEIRAPILDGNVKRVLCRYLGIEGWPGESAVAAQLWSLSERCTPQERAGDYNQAMMDLGATVCTARRPACQDCPLAGGCRALREGLTQALPTPRPKRQVPIRKAYLLLLQDVSGAVYLERRPPLGIWGGLWCLPMFDDEGALRDWLRLGHIAAPALEALPERRHTFSHFNLDYIPILVRHAAVPVRVGEAQGALWLRPNLSAPSALPAPVRKLIDCL